MRFVLALVLAVVACTPRGGGAETFGVSYPDATSGRAKLGARFSAKPSARCLRDDGSEARWAITGARVASGALPPGITIEDGELAGTPTRAGDFSARLVISGITCAGKSYPDQTLDVHVTVH
jgi:hypothetical protein